jgi:hypothetical protein
MSIILRVSVKITIFRYTGPVEELHMKYRVFCYTHEANVYKNTIVVTYKHNSTYNLPEVQSYVTLNLILFTFRS